MIAYFPTPYPDELWYSVCARYAQRMDFGTETGAMQALYGSRYAIANVDLPFRLGALACQLPSVHPCTVDKIIDQHTFLPYYGPFLQTSAYARVREWMSSSTDSSVRAKCGASTTRVRLPRCFRSCPECDKDHRRKYDETYWVTLFQMPGVEVCPKHRVFLECSEVGLEPLANRHKYFAAETDRLATTAHPVNSADPAQKTLIHLAEGVDWMLRQERLNPGLEFLHRQYRVFLGQQGFVARGGSLRVREIRQRIIDCYGEKLLELLQCPLSEDTGDGWLGQLLRNSNAAAPPVRHLLVLNALDIRLEQFFRPASFKGTSQSSALAAGPWSCLNAVCEHRGKLSITNTESQPADTNGNLHLLIRCPHCGFAYLIKEGNQQPRGANRVADYGPLFKQELGRLWADPLLTLREIAKSLGVDPKTAKHRAYELGLIFPRPGKHPVTRAGVGVPKRDDRAKVIESHRKAWTQARQQRRDAGTKELRYLNRK